MERDTRASTPFTPEMQALFITHRDRLVQAINDARSAAESAPDWPTAAGSRERQNDALSLVLQLVATMITGAMADMMTHMDCELPPAVMLVSADLNKRVNEILAASVSAAAVETAERVAAMIEGEGKTRQ